MTELHIKILLAKKWAMDENYTGLELKSAMYHYVIDSYYYDTIRP